MSELRALKKVTTRPPAHAAGPRLPRQSGAERRARLQDGRCPVHGRVFELRHHPALGTVVGTCTRQGCDVHAVIDEGVWKVPDTCAHLVEDNHLDDADALLTLARCISRAERRVSPAVRRAVTAELGNFSDAWLSGLVVEGDAE